MLDLKQLSIALAISLVACRAQPREAPAAEVEAVEVEASSAPDPDPEPDPELGPLDNARFRTEVVTFVRRVATAEAAEPGTPCSLPAITTPLHTVVSVYGGGKLRGRGRSTQDDLCAALSEAARGAVEASRLPAGALADVRFVVELSRHAYGMVEFEGRGLELVKGQVPVRVVDAAGIRERIDAGVAYLLRVMDPNLGGVHKYYRAPTDSFEGRLHTIYTASTVYTLLAVYAQTHNEALREPIERGAQFLLSMQRVAPGLPGHGAFHYSMDLEEREREPLFVVGTTSKSIFTLIELHALTKDAAYLQAARMAGDWLLTMQDPDGSVTSKLHPDDEGELSEGEQESTLYTGQVLSALSRLYVATAEPRYLEGASRTAAYLRAKQAKEGCYVGDDYRSANPISSSWMILSLHDFARASDDASVDAIAYGCADELLERQIDAPEDVYRHGRWSGSLSSSGNGWLAEVLAVLVRDCPTGDPDHCARYRDAAIRSLRLLMQYTYSPENSFVTKNPDMAQGGLFWNTLDRDVRTDSVCHAMNAYVFMVEHLPDGPLLELPEPDFSLSAPPGP